MSDHVTMTTTDTQVRIAAHFGKLPRVVNRELRKELGKLGMDIRNNILEKMQSSPEYPKKSYRRGGKIYHPSIPGNPPRVDGGRLWGSFEIHVSGDVMEVGTNVSYAKYLQKGTAKMDARPFLEAGMEGIDFEERIKDALTRGFDLI